MDLQCFPATVVSYTADQSCKKYDSPMGFQGILGNRHFPMFGGADPVPVSVEKLVFLRFPMISHAVPMFLGMVFLLHGCPDLQKGLFPMGFQGVCETVIWFFIYMAETLVLPRGFNGFRGWFLFTLLL